jgi:hypothetical protein
MVEAQQLALLQLQRQWQQGSWALPPRRLPGSGWLGTGRWWGRCLFGPPASAPACMHTQQAAAGKCRQLGTGEGCVQRHTHSQPSLTCLCELVPCYKS